MSSSDTLFSFCPRSFPASGIFPMSHLFASDDQNTGASALASVLPVSIQGWSPSRLTGLMSLLSKELSGVFSSTQFEDISPLVFCLLYQPALTTICDQWEDYSLTIRIFVGRVTSLLFNTPSRFVITVLPKSTHLPISWLQSPSAVVLDPRRGNLSLLPPFPGFCLLCNNEAGCRILGVSCFFLKCI